MVIRSSRYISVLQRTLDCNLPIIMIMAVRTPSLLFGSQAIDDSIDLHFSVTKSADNTSSGSLIFFPPSNTSAPHMSDAWKNMNCGNFFFSTAAVVITSLIFFFLTASGTVPPPYLL